MAEAELTKLRQSLGSSIKRSKAFYFHTEAAADRDALARGLAALFPAPVHLFRLEGDHVTPDQGSDVLTALRGGETVMLVVCGQHPLAVRFLEVWSDANRATSGGYFGKIGRHLTISLDRSDVNRGILVVLQIAGDRGGRGWRRFLEPKEVAECEALGADARDWIVRDIGVRSRIHEAAGLTFKDLCLLHLRDGPENGQRPPNLILDHREALVAWIDLREILRTRGANAERQMGELRRKGLLDDERYNFYLLAIDFLDSQTGSPTRSGVYEAVWRYEFLEADGCYFRGQASSSWKLDTSLFRATSDDRALDVATLAERAQRTSLFLAALRQREGDLFAGSPSDEDLLAVAQHYGFATPLLDFSRSLRVAAFFATDGADKLSAEGEALGVIYYLKPDERRSQQLLDRTKPIGIEGFDLLRETGLHFGQWKVLEPALADADNRIARQRGAFLEGANVRHLSGMVLGRIVFEQHPDEVFEDSPAGVTRAALLPDRSRLAELADDVKRRFAAGERASMHPAMTRVALPTPSIIGVQHAWLDEQVEEAVDFFSLLGEAAETGGSQPLIRGLVSSLQEYFVEVRLLADLGVLPARGAAGESQSSPLSRAVARMCEESGAAHEEVWKIVRELVPDWEDGTWRAPDVDGEHQLDKWLVLACAVYLVGWEHLTSVHGARSRAFSVKAREILYMVRDKLKGEL